MNTTSHTPFLTVFFAAGLLISTAFVSAPALAADDIQPPPEVSDANARNHDAPAAADAGDEPLDLQQELAAPKKGEEVDVRSYQNKDGAQVSEYSSHGRVYMVKIQPAGGMPAYYLYDDNGDGEFNRRLPGGAKRISPPSWVIKRF